MQNWPQQLRSKVILDLIWPKNSHFGSMYTVIWFRFGPEIAKICFLAFIKSEKYDCLKIHKNDPYSWGQRSNFDLIWPKNSHFGSIDTVRRYRFEPKLPKSCFLVLIISRRKHFLKIRKVDLYGWSQRSIFVLIWPRNSYFGFIYMPYDSGLDEKWQKLSLGSSINHMTPRGGFEPSGSRVSAGGEGSESFVIRHFFLCFFMLCVEYCYFPILRL